MAPRFRYGFKKDAELIAEEVRKELELELTDRLDPIRLAKHLAIPVIDLTELRVSGVKERSLRQFLHEEPGDFSAMTILRGTARLIVVNPQHPNGRRANSICHELSHVLLEHDPYAALSSGGSRVWSDECESEADWLAGALLVPRSAALETALLGIKEADAATHFGVSIDLMRWRLNATGARKQVERSRLSRQSSTG